MQTLILPGYSAKNKEWVDETANKLKIGGIVRPFHWAHWRDESIKFDAKEKAELIRKHIKGDKVNIIAKSLGTLVASYLWQLVPDQIGKVIFCGIPINDITPEEVEEIKTCISKSKNKFIAFQNVDDPHGRFDDVKKFGSIQKTDRDDHNYPFYEEFNSFLI